MNPITSLSHSQLPLKKTSQLLKPPSGNNPSRLAFSAPEAPEITSLSSTSGKNIQFNDMTSFQRQPYGKESLRVANPGDPLKELEESLKKLQKTQEDVNKLFLQRKSHLTKPDRDVKLMSLLVLSKFKEAKFKKERNLHNSEFNPGYQKAVENHQQALSTVKDYLEVLKKKESDKIWKAYVDDIDSGSQTSTKTKPSPTFKHPVKNPLYWKPEEVNSTKSIETSSTSVNIASLSTLLEGSKMIAQVKSLPRLIVGSIWGGLLSWTRWA